MKKSILIDKIYLLKRFWLLKNPQGYKDDGCNKSIFIVLLVDLYFCFKFTLLSPNPNFIAFSTINNMCYNVTWFQDVNFMQWCMKGLGPRRDSQCPHEKD